MQKIKDKYADQDEDERKMRMQLLGSKKVKGFDQIKIEDSDFKKDEQVVD